MRAQVSPVIPAAETRWLAQDWNRHEPVQEERRYASRYRRREIERYRLVARSTKAFGAVF